MENNIVNVYGYIRVSTEGQTADICIRTKTRQQERKCLFTVGS